jgi:hypothetical protein
MQWQMSMSRDKVTNWLDWASPHNAVSVEAEPSSQALLRLLVTGETDAVNKTRTAGQLSVSPPQINPSHRQVL